MPAGAERGRPLRDEIVHSFGQSPAATQPIHPGSYILVEKPLDDRPMSEGLTLEIWIRRWRTVGRQAILGQFDEPDSCGFGLFVNEDGSLSFYVGDGGRYDERQMLRTPPNQLVMVVNPEGLKHFPDNTPSSVASNQWHHVVARYDGNLKLVWVDGRQVSSAEAGVAFRPGSAPLRIGAAGRHGAAAEFLDADIAMPAIYGKALSPSETASRFATSALQRPADASILACWPLSEERGDALADVSPHGRNGRIINRATWMIGGPSFHADVPRFTDYSPEKDSSAGTVSGWRRTTFTTAVGTFRTRTGYRKRLVQGSTPAAFDFIKAAKIDSITLSSSSRRRPRASGADRVHLLDQYLEGLRGDPVQPDVERDQEVDWEQRVCQQRRRPAGVLLLPPAQRRPGDLPDGLPDAVADRRPLHHHGPGRVGLQPPLPSGSVRPTWLENQGYEYDVLSDTDVHLDPHALDDYKVIYVVGHSEYWSFEAMENVSRFLDRGGNAIVLSGNTAFWRVSFNEDASVIECRKGDAPGTQVRADRRGEMWHSHDGRRGGMSASAASPPGGYSASSIALCWAWDRPAPVLIRSGTPTTFCSASPTT